MASFYSKPADYGTYTQPINLDLVNFVMKSKQQKYDYNLAKLESKITDQLGSIDLARTEDKKYFLDKANEVVSAMGDISKMDLTQNGVTRQIDSKLNSIVDARVVGDIISTKNYRSFQNTLQAKQKEGKGAYSQLNAAFSMDKGGINGWLNGESESLGQVQYEDFTDVGSELKDISENLHKHARVVKKFRAEGFYFVSQEGEELTSKEVRAIAEMQLSDKAKRQMQINGWGNYDGGAKSAEEITSVFNEFKQGQLGEVDTEIKKLKLKVDNLKNTDIDTTEAYNSKLQGLQDYRNKIERRYQNWEESGNTDSMTTTMENERVMSQFGDTFSINNVGDPVLSANSVAVAFEKMRFSEAQAKRKALTDKKEESDSMQVIDVGTNLTPLDRLDSTVDKANSYEQAYQNKTNILFDKLTKEQQEGIDSDYDKQSGITKAEHRYNEMSKLLDENNGIITNEAFQGIEEDKLRYERHKTDFNEAMDYGIQLAEDSNVNRIVEEYYDNKGIKMIGDSGEAVPVYEYLRSKGIRNGDDLNRPENKDIKNKILMSNYADKIVSSRQGLVEGFDKIRLSIAEGLQNMGITSFGDGSPESNQREIDKIKSKKYGASEEIKMLEGRLLTLSGSREAAEALLNRTKEKGVYDRNVPGKAPGQNDNLFYHDDSVTDDNTLGGWVTRDSVRKAASSYLNDLTEGGRSKGIVMSTKSEAGIKLLQLANSPEATANRPITFKEADGQSVTIMDYNADEVTLSGTKVIKGVETPVQTTILKSSLPPEVLSKVNFNPERALFDERNMKEVSQKVKFKNVTDVEAIEDLANTFMGGDIQSAVMTTKEANLDMLRGTYPNVMGSVAKPTYVGAAVERAFDSGNMKVKIAKESSGKFRVKITITNPTTQIEEVLDNDNTTLRPEDYDSAYKMAKRMPQTYVATMIQNQVDAMSKDPDNPTAVMQKILKYYGGDK